MVAGMVSLPIPLAMELVLGAIGLTALIVLYRQAERRQLQEIRQLQEKAAGPCTQLL
jgi:hypothetical protein